MTTENQDALNLDQATPPDGAPSDALPGDTGSSPENNAAEQAQAAEQSSVQKRINELTYQRHEEARKAEQLQQELDRLKAQQPQTTGNTAQSEQAPAAPAFPEDPYDEGAMRQYHTDMAKYSGEIAAYNAREVIEQQTRAQQEQAQKTQAQQQQQEQFKAYQQNALKAGVDVAKLAQAEQILAAENVSPELASYIMTDPAGPQIATYLLDNPMERQKVLSVGGVISVAEVAANIKPKAVTGTPSISQAPAPLGMMQGGGVSVKDSFSQQFPDAEII